MSYGRRQLETLPHAATIKADAKAVMNTPDKLSFDLDKHEYRLSDRRVPSVTQVIGSNVKGWQADDWVLQRGHFVHQAIHLHLQNNLDWSSLDERIVGRVTAVSKFLVDLKLKVVLTEHRLASSRFHFAGTIDAIVHDESGKVVLIDWKATLVPQVQIQLGAYCILYTENTKLEPLRVMAVETHDDGTYKIMHGSRTPKADHAQFNLKDAENVFLAMLSVAGWKTRNKIKEETDYAR